MDKQEAIDIIRACALPGQAHDALIEQLLPSARVLVQEDDGRVVEDTGASYLGGRPYLPSEVTWPVWDSRPWNMDEIAFLEAKFQENPKAIGIRRSVERLRQNMPNGLTPLAFIGQLNLAELAAATRLEGWPHEGMLAFFYDAGWGANLLERRSSRVMYFPASAAFALAAPPADLAEGRRFPARTVTFRREWTLPTEPPSYQSKDDMVAKRQQLQALGRQLGSLSSNREPIHRCEGHPQQIQNDMRLYCQVVTNGLYIGHRWPDRDRMKELEPGAADWHLLLQVDSDKRVGWMWGDLGRVYFWARQQAIAARDFDSAWTIVQCY